MELFPTLRTHQPEEGGLNYGWRNRVHSQDDLGIQLNGLEDEELVYSATL